jgi:hypothetical protein
MDGIIPPTSTRQPFDLYAATSASLASQDYNFAERYQTAAAGRAALFVCTIYSRYYRGTRTREEKTFPVHTSLRSLCAATSPKRYNVIAKFTYHDLTMIISACPAILRETVPARPF